MSIQHTLYLTRRSKRLRLLGLADLKKMIIEEKYFYKIFTILYTTIISDKLFFVLLLDLLRLGSKHTPRSAHGHS